MRDLISNFRAFFTAKIGHCGTCMRQSLAATLAMWGVFGLGLLLWPSSLVQGLLGVSAFALTFLWLLHLATYAVRRVAGAASVPTQSSIDNLGRRHALGDLLRAAGAGVVVSAPVLLWPSAGFAFCGQCTRTEHCGSGFVCKNTAPVNSGKVCNECVRS